MSVEIQTKLTGNLEEYLRKFSTAVQEKVLFSGVARMADVLYEVAQQIVPVSSEGHWFHGSSFRKHGTKYWFEPGSLKAAIYRVYSPERSSNEKKTYKVTWNHKKAPYGFMVEYGTSRAPAHAFMRPTFDHIGEAIYEGQRRMEQRLSEGVV